MGRRRQFLHCALGLAFVAVYLAFGATAQGTGKTRALRVHGDTNRRLLHTDGHTDDSITISYPLEAGRKAADYRVTFLSSASKVVDKGDIEVLPGIESTKKIVNTTLSCDFQRSVGVTKVRISILRSDGSEYQAVTIHYIIVGISFYTVDRKTRKHQLLPGNRLHVKSYAELVAFQQLYYLHVLICFPDGKMSSSSTSAPQNSKLIQTVLKDIKISGKGSKMFPSHSFDICTTNHAILRADMTVALDKGCNFGFISDPDIYIVLRFLPYRVGAARLTFTSEALVSGSDFEEAYETSFAVVIGGKPPPAIVSITPSSPFQSKGGDITKAAVTNTAPSSILSFILNGKEMKRFGTKEYISSSKTTISSFITPPGEGQNLPYKIQVVSGNEKTDAVWGGESSQYEFNYASTEASANRIEPNFGRTSGGTIVKVFGNFPGFSASPGSGNGIYVGRHIVDKKDVISVSTTLITFKMPPKITASPHSFDVSVFVVVDGRQTRSVKFEYESLSLININVIGSSYDRHTKVHSVCSRHTTNENENVFFVPELNQGARISSISYSWQLVEQNSRKMLRTSKLRWFVIPRALLNSSDSYNVIVIAQDSFLGTQLKSSVQVLGSDKDFYGLSIATTRHRTPSSPLTDLRVAATLFNVTGCQPRNASNRIGYEWTYSGVPHPFSFQTTEISRGETGGRRFGRELIISRKDIKYGIHLVTCKAYNLDDKSLIGTAALNVSVSPSPLRAIIGAGQSFVQVSRRSAIKIRGDASSDPDSASLDPSTSSGGLEFMWRCEVSTVGAKKFESSTPCPKDVFPSTSSSKNFITIPSQSIGKLQSSGNESVFLRVYLTVRKTVPNIGVFSSPEEVQVVEVSSGVPDVLDRTSSTSIDLRTSSGAPVDRENFAVADSLVLTPTGPAVLEWRFKLIEPETDSLTFLDNPKHLLPFPGYVEANDLLAGRRSLGIRDGTLKPDTSYKFRVEFEPVSGQKTGTYEEIVVKTQKSPEISFPPLVQSTGTTKNIFVARAELSFRSTEVKYYFYIRGKDGITICADGCSGNDIALFRIPVAGTYNISCSVRNARGLGKESFAAGEQTITVLQDHSNTVKRNPVSASIGGISHSSEMNATLTEAVSSGDHAAFEIGSLSVALAAKKISIKTKSQSSTVNVVQRALYRLCQLAGTSEPNTPQGKDYIQIALAFSSAPIGSESMSDPQAFANAICIVQNGIQNTPSSESFDLTPQLVSFFENMAKHAHQLASGGSGRKRLVQSASGESETNQVNTQILDLSEVASSVVSTALSRNEPCGFNSSREIYGVSKLSIAVACNIEQGAELKGENSTLSWCPSIFEDSKNLPVVFVLSELPNYISDSNVLNYTKSSSQGGQNNPSKNPTGLVIRSNAGPDSVGIVKTYAMKNSEMSAAFGSSKMVPAESGLEIGKECFTLNQTVMPTRASFTEGNNSVTDPAISCSVLHAVLYENVKTFGKPLPQSPYKEVPIPGGRTFATFGDGSKETYVLAKMSSVNDKTFGARRSNCRTATPLLAGVSAFTGLTVGLLVAVVASTLLMWLAMTWWVGSRTEPVLGPVAAGAPYIERDVYGRDMVGRLTDFKQMAQAGKVGDDEQVVFANLAPRE